MARASFGFGRREEKPKFSLNFLNNDEEDGGLFGNQMRRGLSSSFAPVDDIGELNQDAFLGGSNRAIKPPSFPAMDAFRTHMGNMPRMGEEEYAPGLGRKIGAALVGFAGGLGNPLAGAKMTRDILDNPYRQAYQNWEQEAEILGQGADQETDRVNREIQWNNMYRQSVRDAQDDERKDRTADLDERKFLRDLNNDKIEQDQKVAEMNARGWEKSIIDGRVIMHNPLTKERQDIGVDADTRIKEAQLRVNQGQLGINQQNADTALMNADTNAYSARTGRINSDTNLMNVESLIDSRENQSRVNAFNAQTRANNSTANRPKNIPMREQYLAEARAAEELIKSNPKYAQYYDAETGQIKRPRSWGGINEEEFKEFNDLVEEKKWQMLNRTYGSKPTDDNVIELSIDDLKG